MFVLCAIITLLHRNCLQQCRDAWKLLYMVALWWIKVYCGCIPLPESITHSCPQVKFKPPELLETPNQEVSNNKPSGEGVRPKDSTCLDFYILDGKGSRLRQLSPKHSGVMSQTGNLPFIVKLHNLMKRFRTPFLEWIGLLVISMPWRLPP